MSLKVWLPLDGDLRNLGTSDIEVTNNGATVDNAGKIGKCYSFDGSNDYITITYSNFPAILAKNFSIAFWVYSDDDGTRSVYFGNYGLSGSGNWFNLEKHTANEIRFWWNNGNPDKRFNNTKILSSDGWTHFTLTKNEGIIKTYLNGQLIETYTNENLSSAIPSTATIFRIGGDYRTSGDLMFKGKMNDFRIYDHCLSAAEVHEIAQGLVVHYKLDSMKIKTGTNLVTGVTKGGRTTVLTDGRIGVQTTGKNADTYFTINLSESITNGTRYFLSCDASGIPNNGYWYFPLGTQSNHTLPFRIYNGHNEYSFIANDISWGENRLFMDDSNRQYWDGQASFWNFELYKEPSLEAEDSSGYGHNGEIINEITISSDTPRYISSTKFNGSNAAIKIPDNKWMVQGAEAMTINLWAKSTAWAGAHLFSCTESGGFNTEAGNSGYLRFPIRVYTNAEKTSSTYKYDSKEIEIASLSTTDWNMITFIYDSTGTRTYINGELHHTYSYTSYGIRFNTNARLFLGCEANTASPSAPYFNGQISDFRIYYTPLLDTDIKLLYNIGSRIDNLGGVHSFELNEKQFNLFRSELIMPFARNNIASGIGEIIEKNDEYCICIKPYPFYKNLENEESGTLVGYFQPNTSYIFDMWMDTSEKTSSDNYSKGGFTIYYTDNTTDSTFLLQGDEGWQHKKLITPLNKSVQKISINYYNNVSVLYRLDSFICKTDDIQITKTGLLNNSNIMEGNNIASFGKGGNIYSSEFIEI